jgi:hypothetical protein
MATVTDPEQVALLEMAIHQEPAVLLATATVTFPEPAVP